MLKFKFISIVTTGFAVLAGASGVTAGTVSVEADSSSGGLVVEAQDATTDEILRRLAQTQPFEIEQLGDAVSKETVTLRYHGAVKAVLERVLENQSHLVITNSGRGDVRRVVVYGARRFEQAAFERATPVAMPVSAPAAVTTEGVHPAVDSHLRLTIERAKKDAEAAKALPGTQQDKTSPYLGHRSAMMGVGFRSRSGF